MAEARSAGPPLGISERMLLSLITAIQFINVLEFMIVSPLGPDFAKELDISLSHLGLLGGSYTASAAVAGALGSKYLDRFDRRKALGVALAGLVVSTALAGFAQNLSSLMAARVLAGLFGGPASSVALAVIADVVPSRRRGRALGLVMSGFAAASVLGVPLSLELARQAGWRAPFFAVALLGTVVGIAAITALPELRLHMRITGQRSRIFDFLGERAVLFSLSATFSVMVSSFCIIPNLSAYLQHNCGFPRSQLSSLYLIGGSVSFVITRVIGGYIDRLGATRVAALGSALFVLVLIPVFVLEQRWIPNFLAFSLFMSASAVRNVSINALTSRVPQPHERARFMSLQSAMQHLAAACGAALGAVLLSELPSGQLGGMPLVASVSVGFASLLPFVLWQVEKVIRMRRPSLPEPWMNTLEATRSSFPPTA
jgi:predicted MFS family arabinose efflux permease